MSLCQSQKHRGMGEDYEQSGLGAGAEHDRQYCSRRQLSNGPERRLQLGVSQTDRPKARLSRSPSTAGNLQNANGTEHSFYRLEVQMESLQFSAVFGIFSNVG